MNKTTAALVLAGSLAFFGAGAANAAEYPAPEPGTVSDATVAPGATIVFSGTGFFPGEAISVTVDYSNVPVVVPGTGINGPIILAEVVNSFTTNADDKGNFSTNVTLGEAGTYTLTATGLESGHVVTAIVSGDEAFADNESGSGNGAPEANEDDLANTGADSSMLLWGAAGVVALGAGVASVAIARRKNA